MMQRIVTISCLFALSGLVACGGGGGGGDTTGGVLPEGGSSTNLRAAFQPEQPSPGPGSATLQPGSSSGNSVSVLAQVTDVDDVYGASFDLVFDATKVEFLGHSPGDLLEDGGASVSYQVQQTSSGRIVVGITRLGATSGASAVGTRDLVRLTFRVIAEGSSSASLQNASLLDSQTTPTSIPGVTWAAGTFVAR